MKQLLKKTAALWIIAAILLVALWVPVELRADAAGAGTAYLTVELLSIGGDMLCNPGKIEIVAGETAAQTFMRYLCAQGYTAYYTGTSVNNYKLGYIADGDKSESHNGYSSSIKAYPVPTPKKIAFTGEMSPYAQAILTTFGIHVESPEINLTGWIGDKDICDTAGWIFSINNQFVTQPLSAVKLSDGDTLRVQFSLVKGRELGFAYAEDGAVSSIFPDRSKLIRLVVDYADNHAGIGIYDEVARSLTDLMLTTEDINSLEHILISELKERKIYKGDPTTNPPPSNPTQPDPTQPTQPNPTQPTQPTQPNPTQPTQPNPTQPTQPTQPNPTQPTQPNPTQPTQPNPTQPTQPTQPNPTQPTQPTTKPPTTQAPTTKPSTTQAPTTQAPTTKAPTTQAPTTAKSSSATNSSTTTTIKQYSPLTTVKGETTTLPGETTTIERPTGIVLKFVSKQPPTTEPETTEEETTAEEETTEASLSLLEKVKRLGVSSGTIRNIAIAVAAVIAAVVVALVLKTKLKKTV